MKVSVIIPVYNAGKYLAKAVESALAQKETDEVVLVEDGSPDDSLEVCKKMEQGYNRVKLFRHPNGQNKGAGATRNLGIKMAKNEIIAFLDADDYFLENRFQSAKDLFHKNNNIDGVYEAIGYHYYDADARIKWESKTQGDLTTIDEQVKSDNLFELLINGKKGYLHLDGLVLKKKVLNKCGLFFDNLRLHQDTAFFFQLAACGNLASGKLDAPVALRGIHRENRILSNYDKHRTTYMMWSSLFNWAIKRKINRKRIMIIYYRYLLAKIALTKRKEGNRTIFLLLRICISETIRNPLLFLYTMPLILKRH